LRPICHYSEIVVNIEDFIRSCQYQNDKTQVYESFAQCLTEYLRSFKRELNKIGSFILKRETKFTLIDLLARIKCPFFDHFDLIQKFLQQINDDTKQMTANSDKSINLLIIIHKYMINYFSITQCADHNLKLLTWLFARTIRSYLTLIDVYMEQGIFSDTHCEYGFKRNETVTIGKPNFWKDCYERIIDNLEEKPHFLQIILDAAFKIYKNVEIFQLSDSFRGKSQIYDQFLDEFQSSCCQYLINNDVSFVSDPIYDIPKEPLKDKTLLELNFSNLNTQEKIHFNKNDCKIISVEELLFESTLNADLDEKYRNNFNFEIKIEKIIENCFSKLIESSTNQLIHSLFEKYKIVDYFNFIHSFFLFKSSEIMFIFSCNLFDIIKNYEIYQDNIVLNKLMAKAMTSVYVNTSSNLIHCNTNNTNQSFSNNLIKIHYAEPAVNDGSTIISSRLINTLKLKIKLLWPFNIIIKQQDIEIYNKAFLLIMQTKQVKYDLDNLQINGSTFGC
jgi:hypothetical protein